MFELLVMACLRADPDICADRLLPLAADSEAACEAAAPARMRAWRPAADELAISNWRCVDAAATGAAVAPLAVSEVAEGVFVHEGRIAAPGPESGGDLSNIGFVVGDEAVAAIDAGGSRQIGERLYAAIRRRTDLPIRWLILTHMHPDHSLGAEVFREAGSRIVGHRKLDAALRNRATTYSDNFRRLLGERAYLGTAVVLPDAGPAMTEIDLGGRVLELRPFPTAHTDNDMTVFDRKTATWFTGDLVFARHTPAIDGSILGWLDALEAMAAMGAARIVPGHGPATLPWPEGGDGVRRYLVTLVEQTRAAIARGESMRTAIEHLGEDMRPDWELFDEYNPRNATAAYKELEWE